jgi:hypothetical protein
MEPEMMTPTPVTELVIPVIEVEETSVEREVKELQEVLDEEKKAIEHLASRPYIDHLDDAIVDGVFVVPVGSKVVIERYYEAKGKTFWLDTRSYDVVSVNPGNGDLRLFDNDVLQSASSNYIRGPERGYRFKVATKTTRLKGRGKSKPKKAKIEKTGPKRGRGNPGKPGVRRIYDVKKLGICTRLKGVAYVACEGTKAIAGDRLQVSAPAGGNVVITHPDLGWTETWKERPGA